MRDLSPLLPDLTIQPASAADLPVINAIIEACVANWDLPERVKRLALAGYFYRREDLECMQIVVACFENGKAIGVGAIGPVPAEDLPAGKTGALLHGLYVAPPDQKKGVGQRLLDWAWKRVDEQALDGLLVKAQADANPYFARQGFSLLPVNNPGRDYPYRWWREAAPPTGRPRPSPPS